MYFYLKKRKEKVREWREKGRTIEDLNLPQRDAYCEQLCSVDSKKISLA